MPSAQTPPPSHPPRATNHRPVAAGPSRPLKGKAPAPSPPPEKSFPLIWVLISGVVLVILVLIVLMGRREMTMTGQPPAPPSEQVEIPAPSAPPAAGLPAEAPASVPSPPPPAAAPVQAGGQSRLKVISMHPTNQTFNYRDAMIEIEFSLPVRSETVPAAFKVSPPVDGTFAWPNPTKLVFTPRQLLEHGKSYLVSLESGITDTSGSARLEPTSWSFSTVKKYYYERDIVPWVNANCLSCHRADGPAARVNLASREDILRYIQPGDARRSSLLAALRDSNHQGRLGREATAKLYLINDWVTLFKAE